MKITIEKIVYPGKSLARVDGKVIFTNQGMPGETVEISVIKETKSYTQAKTTKIITPSDKRQSARCGHYQACSLYQCIDYTYQTQIKKQQLQEILTRQVKTDLPELEFRPSPKIWGYRNKIKLRIIWKGKSPQLVYNLPETLDQFIPIDECFLSLKLTNSFLKAFLKTIITTPLTALNTLTVKENFNKELLVTLYHDNFLNIKTASDALKSLTKEFPISGLVIVDRRALTKTILLGNDFFKETIEDIDFYIGAKSFFQVNTSILPILIKDLQDNLDLNTDKVLADLYCGVGTFGILLSSKVKQVIGVEVDTENFFFMEKNIKENNIQNFDVRLCDCKETINSLLKQNIDIAIIDPPRKGMDKSICNALAKSGPASIAYISCNPTTLARDLVLLLPSYEIKKTYGYDFFPHTAHIETMVILKKK